MKHTRVLQFCAGLETKLDEVLFRQPDDEKKGSSGLATAAQVAAAGTAAGAGAYGADRLTMKKYGTRQLLDQGASGPLGSHNQAPRSLAGTAAVGRANAYGAAARDLSQTVNSRVGAGIGTARRVFDVRRARGAGLIDALRGALGKGGRALVGTR
jgi:hypothetical protein